MLAAVWPQEGTREAESLHKKIGVPAKGSPQNFKQNYQKILTVAQVVFIVCQSATDALLTGRYSQFDGHLKNYGCHTTALDVKRKVKQLKKEALSVQDLCVQKRKAIEAMFDKPRVGKCNMTFLDYCQQESVDVDIRVTKAFGELVAYHFLHLIHAKVASGNEEVPTTCTDPLERIKNSLEYGVRGNLMSFLTWVEGVQAKMSHYHVGFIQEVARTLCEKHDRTHVVRKFVSSDYMQKARKSTAVMLPQSYTTEAVMYAIKGILVVKYKLTIGDRPIDGAVRDVVFMHMPKAKILSDEEVRALDGKKAVIVLEGFRGEGADSLEALIKAHSVYTLLHSSVAKGAEYTNDYEQRSLEQDDHRLQLAKLQLPFRADHMYASSVKEERHG